MLVALVALAGCGSASTQSTGLSKRLCRLVVPAWRQFNFMQTDEAIATNMGGGGPTNAQLASAYSGFAQAYKSAAAIVPASRRNGFSLEVAFLQEGARAISRGDVSAVQADANHFKPDFPTFKANLDYIYSQCGGQKAVDGTSASKQP